VAPGELERYLHDHIPLSRAMQVFVLSMGDDHVELGAPLGPNINHRDTVFGGSASALGILAAWSLLHVRLCAVGVEARLVIQRNTMEYELPIAGTFSARSKLDAPHEWQRFLTMLTRKRKGRISASSVLAYQGQSAGLLVGDFVALLQ